MKRASDYIEEWRTDADDDVTLAGFAGAMAVLALFCIVLYLALLTAGVAR